MEDFGAEGTITGGNSLRCSPWCWGGSGGGGGRGPYSLRVSRRFQEGGTLGQPSQALGKEGCGKRGGRVDSWKS